MNMFLKLNLRFRVVNLLIVIVSVTKSLLVFWVSFLVMKHTIPGNAIPRSASRKLVVRVWHQGGKLFAFWLAMLVLLGTMSALAQAESIVSRVSENIEGEQGNGRSVNPSISADGRFVAFSSTATNLVSERPDRITLTVFVKNLETGEIERVSDRAGLHTSLSADGRFVAFSSTATNLVPNDTVIEQHVFVKNLETGETVRASEDAAGVQGNRESQSVSISADGRFVAFKSNASNLVPGDTNEFQDVFVKNVETGEIVRVSENATGVQGNSRSGGVDTNTSVGVAKSQISISADGQFVAFPSEATNLIPGETGFSLDIFVKNVKTGEMVRASQDAAGMQGNSDSGRGSISISANGRFVAFSSRATNLVPSDTNGRDDVFVKNLETGEIVRVSKNAEGMQGNDLSESPSLSADGSVVAFESFASNLVPGDTNLGRAFDPDIFVKNVKTGEIERLSEGPGGAELGVQPNGLSINASISADGRFVAFTSGASNLVPDDTNDWEDVFLADVDGVRAPTTPGNLRFAVYSRTVAEVFWDRSSDNGSVLYEFIRNGELIGVLDALSVFEEDLQPGVGYTYLVTAIDNDDNRSETATVSFTTDDTDPPGTSLSPVTGLRAEIYSATAAEIFWNRMPGPVHYRVYADGVEVAITNGTSWFSDNFKPNSTTEMSVVTFEGPNESVQQSVTVTTRGGNSEEPPSGVPAVTGLRAEVYSKTFAEVFWDRPTGQAYSYRVFFNKLLEVETDGISWWSRDFAPGSITEVTIIAVDSQGAVSPPATVVVQTPGGDIDPESIRYEIGDIGPAGGIVFSVSDDGTDGLEAAPMDQSMAVWCSTSFGIPGIVNLGSRADIDPNSGAANTSAILDDSGCRDAGSAAEVASTYMWPNGQTDGFLPNKQELDLLYFQRDIVDGFVYSFYWSSSERNDFNGWLHNFDDGFQYGSSKNSKVGVRAVRAF